MRSLGKFLGFIIIFLFLLELFRFVLKIVFKKYGRWIKQNTKLHPLLLKLMNLNRIIHPWTGYLIIGTILIHIYIQTGFTWFSASGLVAAGLMLSEVIIGFAGQYVMKKSRPKAWIWFHRLVPVIILLAVFIHIGNR